MDDLSAALKQYFGYDAFRPLQEQIIRDAAAGRDVFALMPTGGGKSLCFQLPAVLRRGLTIVVSPLIALMKDQVDALGVSGIPATFLNSTLERHEAVERLRGLHRGEYKLLYVAPERLMLDGFIERALNWDIAQIAIDEAHCISEWGHDFRPDYRDLKKLRTHFPDVPVLAVTATATLRVRDDIVRQLKLREPRCYVASFNRPNLSYRVLRKSDGYDQLLNFIRERAGNSGIVYCASRRTAEALTKKLQADRIVARPYHAGMESRDRARTQDAFLRDDVQVITATIAFGMGINKPNVRFVVHYDLPKNIESYYQETGRAGRDGLPGECLLLFNPGDAVKQRRFIDEKSDAEQVIARAQLAAMIDYAETRECRRATLLRYFGETFDEIPCGACDNCLQPRETVDGTVMAQKFLSCVHRVREKSGFAFGLNHIVDVLVGADTEPIRRRNHDAVSTFGIGRELDRKGWQEIGRELIRLGLVAAAPGKFATLELTQTGRKALRERRQVMLTKRSGTISRVSSPSSAGNGSPIDEGLFEELRVLRRRLADERDVPAYIIFSDATLRDMARLSPTNLEAFAEVSGVGKRKSADFGETFTTAIAAYVQRRSAGAGVT